MCISPKNNNISNHTSTHCIAPPSSFFAGMIHNREYLLHLGIKYSNKLIYYYNYCSLYDIFVIKYRTFKLHTTMTKTLCKITTLIAASMVVAISLASCNKTSQSYTADELIARLSRAVEQNKILLGHQDATVYGHSWSYEPDRSDVLEVVGDYPAVMGWDMGDIEFAHEKNLDGVPFDLIREEIIKQHSRGGINTISWHAYNPCGGTAWDEGEGMVTSILKGGENYEMFQERLSLLADFLCSLKDANGELIPIIFRPWHEHDGNWFWWGDKWCTHDEYRQLWDMTYNFMGARGLDNLVWCYMPMSGEEEKAPDVEQYDMVGIDVYPFDGNLDRYKERFTKGMSMMKEYRTKYNKLIAISETGYEGMKSDTWFTKDVLPLIEGEPVSYILFWRNAWDKPDHFFCSYKGHSSEADFRKFVETPTIITLKEVESLK